MCVHSGIKMSRIPFVLSILQQVTPLWLSNQAKVAGRILSRVTVGYTYQYPEVSGEISGGFEMLQPINGYRFSLHPKFEWQAVLVDGLLTIIILRIFPQRYVFKHL